MAPRSMRNRDLSPTASLALVMVAALGCTVFAPPTRITVLHTVSADRALREEGKSLDLNHWVIDAAPAGLERGFFVVKSDLEWHQHWPELPADKVPVLPPDFSFAKEMLIIAAPPGHDVISTELSSVIVNEGGMHGYITETDPGIDCPAAEKDGKPNYDIVRVPFIDGKDMQFHLETIPGDACGVAPEAKITCRAEGKDPGVFVEKLTVDPGTKVGCIVGKFTSPRPVIDLTWTFPMLPFGATSKMVVGNRGTGVTFTPDVFGTYSLQVEVLDDLQRRGTSSVDVEVVPRDPLVVQMIWTKFEPDDDPSTFPRIELHSLPLNADGGPVGAPSIRSAKTGEAPLPGTPGAPPIVWGRTGGCSLESAETYCKAKPMGFTTVMSLEPSGAKLYALGVHFTDERVKGQAVPCVRTYRGGKLVADLCDTNPRKADSWWLAGVFDPATAKTVETLAGERAQAFAKATADAKAATEAAAERKAVADKAAAEKAAADAAKAAAAAAAAPKPATSASAAPPKSAAPAPAASAPKK